MVKGLYETHLFVENMPTIAIYFDDPDGHSLEFIGILDGKGKPENGIITSESWLELEKNE